MKNRNLILTATSLSYAVLGVASFIILADYKARRDTDRAFDVMKELYDMPPGSTVNIKTGSTSLSLTRPSTQGSES